MLTIANFVTICACLNFIWGQLHVNVHDPHLANPNNSKIAFEVWTHVVKGQEYSMLGEILEDIGKGCLQGISHRLFSYLLVFI